MPSSRVLAISSSRVGNSGYLEMAAPLIHRFLGMGSREIAFIPFASVDENYEGYLSDVQKGLSALKYSIHRVDTANAIRDIEKAGVIMVGGGNTFKLLHDIYNLGVLELIRDKVRAGIPYIGWSAGSNIAGATICTTNDMPIIQPESFNALNLLPFQVNPHYINLKPDGHNGESRDERLVEFTVLNPGVPVVALPEGTALQLEDGLLRFLGDTGGFIFKCEKNTRVNLKEEIKPGADVSFLL